VNSRDTFRDRRKETGEVFSAAQVDHGQKQNQGQKGGEAGKKKKK